MLVLVVLVRACVLFPSAKCGTAMSPHLLPFFYSGAALVTTVAVNSAASPSGASPSGASLVPPPPRRGTSRRVGAAARFQVASGLLAAGLMLLGMLVKPEWRSLQHGELANFAANLLVIVGPLVALPLMRPDLLERWRGPIMLAFRLAFFSLHNVRGQRAILHVLDDPPSPGWMGALRDVGWLTIGSRVVALLFSGIATPLPLLPHAAASVVVLRSLVRSGPHICALPLLRHPTWQWRFAWVHRLCRPVLLVAPQHLAGVDYSLSDCRSAILCYQLLGVLAPALLVHRFQALLRAGTDDCSNSSGGNERQQAEGRCASRGASAAAAANAAARWTLRGLAAAEAALDRLFCLLDGRVGSRVLRGATWFLLLNVLYTASLAVEHPGGDSTAAGVIGSTH